MVGKNAHDDSFHNKDQVVTLACKTAVRLSEFNIQVDPPLLFQRLSFVVTGGQFDNPQSFFKVEMCSYPPALFDSLLLSRKANKPLLADAIWTRTKNEQTTKSVYRKGSLFFNNDNNNNKTLFTKSYCLQYFFSLCSLWRHSPPSHSLATGPYLHEIPSFYVQHVTQRYSQGMVVLDGYEDGPSTKTVHQRRSGVSGASVNFDSDMVLKLKKDVFLSNTANKQRLIKLLGEKLQLSGCNIIHAPGDADLMKVQMAVQSAKSITTVLVGDDTDLLILLCHHADTSAQDLFFIRQPKQRSMT